MIQKAKAKSKKNRVVQPSEFGHVHIKSTSNNLIISITNNQYQTLSASSPGRLGFKGSKKNTPYAAQLAARECAQAAYDLGVRCVHIFLKGFGAGRDSAIRTVNEVGLHITRIIDVTPIPFGGCRLPKRQKK